MAKVRKKGGVGKVPPPEKRSRSSKKGWQTRRDKAAIKEKLAALLEAHDTGRPHDYVEKRHEEFYEVKDYIRKRRSRAHYVHVMEMIGEDLGIDIENYIET